MVCIRHVSIHAPAGGATCPGSISLRSRRFQSTLPRGERHVERPKRQARVLFQSTLPRGERRVTAGPCPRAIAFQSTLPRGERLFGDVLTRPLLDVSIHAPAGGATSTARRPALWPASFNPRSRGGSDTFIVGEVSSGKVSIHAPAGGATRALPKATATEIVSIHAPAGGATRATACPVTGTYCFNPRSRGGSDTNGRLWRRHSSMFQSTLPRGERHDPVGQSADIGQFQSTLPRGERRRGQ